MMDADAKMGTVGVPEKEIPVSLDEFTKLVCQGFPDLMDGDAEMETVDVQALPEEEARLAKKLRNLCDYRGVERKESLQESADVLFSLGELYFKKAQETKGMQQKLAYIRCSALLNGAEVRFMMGQNVSKFGKVYEALVKLNSSILRSAGITRVGGEEILDFSVELLREIKGWRNDAKQRVANIPIINDGGNEAKEKEKIGKVRFENSKNTEQYMNLVRIISNNVEELLGTPPCKFAIVGLGSLARQEITLYSDFEHVIVLDDEVQQKSTDEYEDIKEYFRWFSVIFQVIMIGFGETFIPSVSIESLNDHYTDDRSGQKNWFYDAYTPCGIAFDGMVPHSCNTPLGRQQATKDRKHVVELIQPASEMAKFITQDEEIKNGYYLHDVLTSTCFVYGSGDIYEVYSTEVKQILYHMTVDYIFNLDLKKIRDNRNEATRKVIHHNDHRTKYDIKAELYRPIATYLCCYGRLNGVADECASFDIVSRLHKDGRITHEFAHELEYAVAVACEARLKVYALSGSERNAMAMKQFVAFVGKESAIKCREVIADLSERYWKLATKTHDQHSRIFTFYEKMVRRSGILMSFGYFEEAIALSKLIIMKCEVISKEIPDCATEIREVISAAQRDISSCYLGLISPENPLADKYCRLCEETCIDMLMCDGHRIRYAYVGILCTLYANQNRPQEFIEMLDLWKRYRHLDKTLAEADTQYDLFNMRMCDFKMRQEITGWDKMLKYLQSELKEENERQSQCVSVSTVSTVSVCLWCHIAIVHIRLGQEETGRKELLRVLSEIIESSPCLWLGKSEYASLLHMIRIEQCQHGWLYDASITIHEEYQVIQATDRAKDRIHVPPVYMLGGDKRAHEFRYKDSCKWRQENNLPLENSKLNIWGEYERMSSHLGEVSDLDGVEFVERALQSGSLDEEQTLDLQNLLPTLCKGDKFVHYHVPESSKLDQMYNVAVTDLLHCNYEKAARMMWKIANNEKADLKMKACEFLIHIVYRSLMRSKLCNIRDLHTKTLPIERKGPLEDKYNEAANNSTLPSDALKELFDEFKDDFLQELHDYANVHFPSLAVKEADN